MNLFQLLTRRPAFLFTRVQYGTCTKRCTGRPDRKCVDFSIGTTIVLNKKYMSQVDSFLNNLLWLEKSDEIYVKGITKKAFVAGNKISLVSLSSPAHKLHIDCPQLNTTRFSCIIKACNVRYTTFVTTFKSQG